MNAIRGKVTESGRLSLPAEFRRAVGLEKGGDVVVELEGNTIRIRPIEQAIAHAQAVIRRGLKGKKGTSVDEFLAERRREAESE